MIARSNTATEEKAEVEWYGKPDRKNRLVSGEPILCYIVGGTCYAEVKMGNGIERQIESLNELAETIGRNLTIGWGLNHLTRSLDQYLQTGRVREQPARPRFVCYAVECLLTKRSK